MRRRWVSELVTAPGRPGRFCVGRGARLERRPLVRHRHDSRLSMNCQLRVLGRVQPGTKRFSGTGIPVSERNHVRHGYDAEADRDEHAALRERRRPRAPRCRTPFGEPYVTTSHGPSIATACRRRRARFSMSTPRLSAASPSDSRGQVPPARRPRRRGQDAARRSTADPRHRTPRIGGRPSADLDRWSRRLRRTVHESGGAPSVHREEPVLDRRQ